MAYHLPNHLLNQSMYEGSYSTQPQNSPSTTIQRVPATQLLTLNSADRFQNSSTGKTNVVQQPWNNFILQRPQNLMEAFATRITISEVRFPWFIPNINSTNNTIWLQAEANLPVSPLTIYPIVVPSGFYTWDLLTTTLNGLIRETTALNPPVVSTNGSQFIFTPGVASGSMFSLYWYNPLTNAPTNQQYLTQSSLALTMGFDWEQVSGGSNVTQALIGNPTELLYTQYVDIVSEKLNYYSQVKDGSSAGSTNKALICRLYISDEVSIGAQIGQIPTIIHRQFKNPKQIMWNKDAVIDFLDVSVLDQFGQLVPLPTIAGVQSMYPKQKIGAWPNFQITLLASEN